MKIVVACDGVVSLYTMVKNLEMLTEEIGLKCVHIEESSLEEVKSERADIFIGATKDKEELEGLDGLIILLNNTMDKQEITLKLLEGFNKLGVSR